MAMENYSPSHPTDEVDLDHSPPIVNADLKELKELKDIKVIKEIKEMKELKEIKENPILPKSERKSDSKSPEKRNSHKGRSRSRSRKRRSRSRSKNRRSRSRNRSDKFHSKSRDYDSRSNDRRSLSKDKRSRSKDRKQRSSEKRSRSKDRRSRSRESKRYHSRNSPSPYRHKDSRSNSERKLENNIFSKMTELSSNKVIDEQVKTKWSYDSDEETKPTTSATKSDTGFTESSNRFDDMKPLQRKSDYHSDSSFSDRNDDQKPYPRRNEFSNNRRGDFSRGNFSRNRQWEPRNSRNNFRNFNNRSNYSGGFSGDNRKQPDTFQKQSAWTEEEDNLENKSVSNDHRDVQRSSISPNIVDASSKPFDSSPGDIKADRSGFAVDSDEECGNWNSNDRSDSKRDRSDSNRDIGDINQDLGCRKSLNELLTIANLESKNMAAYNETEQSTLAPEPSSTAPTAQGSGAADDSDDEEFGAWNNEQKTSSKTTVPSGDSNETRGNKWGQERDHDEDDFGSWDAPNRDRDQSTSGQFDQNSAFYPHGNNQQPRSNFYGRNNNDNNQRYPMNNNNFQNNRRGGMGGGNFNRFQRPMMPMNNNNNSHSNQFHPHQQQHTDRFGSTNYGPGNRNNNTDMMNMKMPPPPLFNPTQRPPHWSMNNAAATSGFPAAMCNGPMPTGPMQFPMNSGVGGSAVTTGMMGGSGPMMPLPPQMQFQPQLGQGMGAPLGTGMSLPGLMQQQQQHSYIPPPPPATQPMQSMQHQSQQHNIQGYGQHQQQPVPSDSSNLLEAIMTNVGLSSKSMELYKSSSSQSSNSSSMLPGNSTTLGNNSSQSAASGNVNRQQQSSVSDSLSSIIKSAASTVLSRLALESASAQRNNAIASAALATASSAAGNISDSMSMSPPSPTCSPPPIIRHSQHQQNSGNNNSSGEPLFVLPPLPNYNDIIKPTSLLISTAHKTSSSSTGITSTAGSTQPSISYSNAMTSVMPAHKQQQSSVSDICQEKRNRSDFDSKSDWQERIALEVKNFLRPAYMGKKINKADYKEIMKRCVTKISRSGVTEINTEKIEKFVLSYVDKYQKFRRGKQHGVVSSSEHELVM